MRRSVWILRSLVSGIVLGVFGCEGPREDHPIPAARTVKADPTATEDAQPASDEEARKVDLEISKLIDSISLIYHPLVYNYDEQILEKMERIVARIDRPATNVPDAEREMKELPLDEENAHFAETIRRWGGATGRDFRKELEALKRDRAGVDAKQAFHPEFHKKFARVFDEFIPIEVAEMRERRNRALHRAAEDVLRPYAESRPSLVRRVRTTILDRPPYALEQAPTRP